MSIYRGSIVLVLLIILSFGILLVGLLLPIVEFSQPVSINSVAPVPSPSTDPIPSDWQTYKNKQFSYSIKMPPNWKAVPQSDDKYVTTFIPNNLPPTEEHPLLITVSKNSQNTSSQKWVDQLFGKDHPREEVSIGNNMFVRARSALSTYQAVIYLIPHKEYMYELYSSVLVGEYAAVVAQMILSFTLQ